MDAVDREGLRDGSHNIDDLRAVLRIGRAEPVDGIAGNVDLQAAGLLHGDFEIVRRLHGVQAVDPCMDLDAMLLRSRDAFFESGLERLPREEVRGEIGRVGGGREGEDGGEAVLSQQRDDGVPALAGQAGQRTAPGGAEFVGRRGDLLLRLGERQLLASARELDGCVVLAGLEETAGRLQRRGDLRLHMLGRVLIDHVGFIKACRGGDPFDVRQEFRRLLDEQRNGVGRIDVEEDVRHPEAFVRLDEGGPCGRLPVGIVPQGGDIELLETGRHADEGGGRLAERVDAGQFVCIRHDARQRDRQVFHLYVGGIRHFQMRGDDGRKGMEHADLRAAFDEIGDGRLLRRRAILDERDEGEGVWFQMDGLAVGVFDDGWMEAVGGEGVPKRFRVAVGFLDLGGGRPAAEDGETGVRTDAFQFGQMDGKRAGAFSVGGDAEHGALGP